MRTETSTNQNLSIRKPPEQSSSYTETFNQTDIDPILLKERATAEWEKITLVGSRTPHQVLMHCYMGQCAELYLLSKGYIDNPNGYYDVFKPDGITEIECKVTSHPRNIEKMLDMLDKRRYGWRQGIADKVYIWLFDESSGDYTFYKTATAKNNLNRYVLDDEIVL